MEKPLQRKRIIEKPLQRKRIVVLDSRDSVALETWDYEDIREDIRTWFENWFAKVVLDSRDSVALERKASPKEAYTWKSLSKGSV